MPMNNSRQLSLPFTNPKIEATPYCGVERRKDTRLEGQIQCTYSTDCTADWKLLLSTHFTTSTVPFNRSSQTEKQHCLKIKTTSFVIQSFIWFSNGTLRIVLRGICSCGNTWNA
jgi:hypothetical protein